MHNNIKNFLKFGCDTIDSTRWVFREMYDEQHSTYSSKATNDSGVCMRPHAT